MAGNSSPIEYIAVHDNNLGLKPPDELDEGAMACGGVPRPVMCVTAYQDDSIAERGFEASGVDRMFGLAFASWRADLEAGSALNRLSAGMDVALGDA